VRQGRAGAATIDPCRFNGLLCQKVKTEQAMKLVFNANDIMEAHIVAGMLHAEGIEAHVGGHYLQGGVGELATMGFATVSVMDDDAAAARKIIERYQTDAATVDMPADGLVQQPS
jgi:hypothetical protein